MVVSKRHFSVNRILLMLFAAAMLIIVMLACSTTAYAADRATIHAVVDEGSWTIVSGVVNETVTGGKQRIADQNRLGSDAMDAMNKAGADKIGSGMTPLISSIELFHSGSEDDPYNDYSKEDTITYPWPLSFPGFSAESWAAGFIKNSSVADREQATKVAAAVTDGFNTFYSAVFPKTSNLIQFRANTQTLIGIVGGLSSNGWSKVGDDEIDGEYVVTISNGTQSVTAVWAIRKGYTPGYYAPGLSQYMHYKLGGSGPYNDCDWINAPMLAYAALANYACPPEYALTMNNVFVGTPSNFEKAITDLVEGALTALRSILGLWAINDLVYSTGTRSDNYFVHGIFPDSWQTTIWTLFYIAEIIALLVLIFGILMSIFRKAASTVNPMARISFMDQIKNTLIVSFTMILLPILFRMIFSVSAAFTDMFYKILPNEDVAKTVSRYSSLSGSLGAIIVQILFFGATIYFNFYYVMRSYLTAALMIISAPCLMAYAVSENGKQIAKSWIAVFLSTILIQPIHALILSLILILPTGGKAFVSIVGIFCMIPITQTIVNTIIRQGENGLNSAALSGRRGAIQGGKLAANVAARTAGAAIGAGIGAGVALAGKGEGEKSEQEAPDNNVSARQTQAERAAAEQNGEGGGGRSSSSSDRSAGNAYGSAGMTQAEQRNPYTGPAEDDDKTSGAKGSPEPAAATATAAYSAGNGTQRISAPIADPDKQPGEETIGADSGKEAFPETKPADVAPEGGTSDVPDANSAKGANDAEDKSPETIGQGFHETESVADNGANADHPVDNGGVTEPADQEAEESTEAVNNGQNTVAAADSNDEGEKSPETVGQGFNETAATADDNTNADHPADNSGVTEPINQEHGEGAAAAINGQNTNATADSNGAEANGSTPGDLSGQRRQDSQTQNADSAAAQHGVPKETKNYVKNVGRSVAGTAAVVSGVGIAAVGGALSGLGIHTGLDKAGTKLASAGGKMTRRGIIGASSAKSAANASHTTEQTPDPLVQNPRQSGTPVDAPVPPTRDYSAMENYDEFADTDIRGDDGVGYVPTGDRNSFDKNGMRIEYNRGEDGKPDGTGSVYFDGNKLTQTDLGEMERGAQIFKDAPNNPEAQTQASALSGMGVTGITKINDPSSNAPIYKMDFDRNLSTRNNPMGFNPSAKMPNDKRGVMLSDYNRRVPQISRGLDQQAQAIASGGAYPGHTDTVQQNIPAGGQPRFRDPVVTTPDPSMRTTSPATRDSAPPAAAATTPYAPAPSAVATTTPYAPAQVAAEAKPQSAPAIIMPHVDSYERYQQSNHGDGPSDPAYIPAGKSAKSWEQHGIRNSYDHRSGTGSIVYDSSRLTPHDTENLEYMRQQLNPQTATDPVATAALKKQGYESVSRTRSATVENGYDYTVNYNDKVKSKGNLSGLNPAAQQADGKTAVYTNNAQHRAPLAKESVEQYKQQQQRRRGRGKRDPEPPAAQKDTPKPPQQKPAERQKEPPQDKPQRWDSNETSELDGKESGTGSPDWKTTLEQIAAEMSEG